MSWVLTALLAISPALPARAGAAVPVSVQDQRLHINLDGRDFSLAARVFRPRADGTFPLVVINHGTPVSSKQAPMVRLSYTQAAQWFAARGYVVVVALRPGFGDSDGPYVERSGPCEDRDYARDAEETAAVEAAIVQSAEALPGVDARHVVVVGQSAGGFGAIALADQPPPGVVGVISFAGGRGGDDHEHICGGEQRLVDATGRLGAANQLPQLWLFAANDHFFPPPLAHAMASAYQAASKARIQFVDLPPFDGDGHKTFSDADPSVWAQPVSAFLASTAPAAGG